MGEPERELPICKTQNISLKAQKFCISQLYVGFYSHLLTDFSSNMVIKGSCGVHGVHRGLPRKRGFV